MNQSSPDYLWKHTIHPMSSNLNTGNKFAQFKIERNRYVDNIYIDINKLMSTFTPPFGSDKQEESPIVISKKSQLIQSLKQEVKKKFKRNDFICLRTKAKDGSRKIDRIYQIRQIVWSIDDTVLKSLVVKQISGPNYNMFTLNRYDCQRIHVKYEPGLQMLSMELPWIKVTNVNSL